MGAAGAPELPHDGGQDARTRGSLARARATMWLSPFINVGVTAGASVIDRGAWVTGVHLGFVSRSFAGTRW